MAMIAKNFKDHKHQWKPVKPSITVGHTYRRVDDLVSCDSCKQTVIALTHFLPRNWQPADE